MKQIQLFVLLCLCAGSALGQSATEFTHTIDYKPTTSPLAAKDFWIAIPKIFNTGDSGKYAEIYIASQQATTIHIRGSRFAPVDRKLKAGEQFIFKVETQDTAKSMENDRCAVVQKKGIHIWSDDADLSVYLYVRNAQSAGGTAILPTTHWGKEYALASWAADSTLGDKPGEFVLVAKEDSTIVTIVPTAPIRQDTFATQILYPADKSFTVRLDRGQAVQYMSQLSSKLPDLTGTSITSSRPVGVFSAVQGVRIYSDDFICEMMPPVCSWGKKYVTINDVGSLEYGIYRVIASKDDQVINYNSHNQTRTVMVQKDTAFEHMDNYDESGIIWESDAPFLVVYYISLYRPAMICATPFESFAKEVSFQLPADSTKVDILINRIDSTFTLDGKSHRQLQLSWVGETNHHVLPQYISFRAVLNKGSHILKSPLGATIKVHGSNGNAAYAWGGPLSTLCIDLPRDTVAPVVTTAGDCNHSQVTVTDVHPNASKLQSFAVDSLVNLQFAPDPAFVVGESRDRFFYDLYLKDITKVGRIVVTVFDAAGNRTTISSQISARPNPVVTPTALQIPYAGTVTNFRTFELSNTSVAPMVLTGPSGLRLSNGNAGFAFVAPDLSVLPVGEKRSFLISYSSPTDTVRRDTVLFGDECTFVRLPLESINKGAVASTTGVDLGCIPVGTSREDVFLVDNFVLYELTVLGVTFDDAVHFTAVAPALPYIIAPEKRVGITVRYTPDAVDTNCTTARIATKELGELTATVCGCGLATGSVRTDASENRSELLKALDAGKAFAWLAPVPNPADRDANVKFTFGLAKAATLTLDLFNLEGKRVATSGAGVYSAGMHEESISIRDLPAGSYLYRYSIDGATYGGMLTIR